MVPTCPGLSDIDYLTNVGILELDTVPEHLVIVGGSYIGLEFAQMYRRFGARVTVVEMGPRLTAREDEDVSAAIKEILESEGIDVVLGADDIRVAKRDDGFERHTARRRRRRSSAPICCWRSGGSPIPTTWVWTRPGSRPTRAATSSVDDQLRTNVEHIWAMGDCNGTGAFTHTSYNDFEIVAANLLDDDPRRVSDRITDLRALHRSAAGPGRA